MTTKSKVAIGVAVGLVLAGALVAFVVIQARRASQGVVDQLSVDVNGALASWDRAHPGVMV